MCWLHTVCTCVYLYKTVHTVFRKCNAAEIYLVHNLRTTDTLICLSVRAANIALFFHFPYIKNKNVPAAAAAYSAGAAQAVEAQQEEQKQQVSSESTTAGATTATLAAAPAPAATSSTAKPQGSSAVSATSATGLGAAVVGIVGGAIGAVTGGRQRQGGSSSDEYPAHAAVTSQPAEASKVPDVSQTAGASSYARIRPMIASDRSESSSSESAPSPGERPLSGGEHKSPRVHLPPVAVPIGPLPLLQQSGAIGSSSTVSGGGTGGSGGGGGGDSMRSNLSASSQASSQLLGVAIAGSMPSEGSFELSPESSPRRRRSPAPTLPPLREASPEHGAARATTASFGLQETMSQQTSFGSEMSKQTSFGSEEIMSKQTSFGSEDLRNTVEAIEASEAFEMAQAKESGGDEGMASVVVAAQDPLGYKLPYSPVQEPPLPLARHAPLMASTSSSSSPEELGAKVEIESGNVRPVAASGAVAAGAGAVAFTPGLSRSGLRRWESTSDAGSNVGSGPSSRSVSAATATSGTVGLAGPSTAGSDISSLSPASVPSQNEGAQAQDEDSPSPRISRTQSQQAQVQAHPHHYRTSSSRSIMAGLSRRGSSVWDTEDDDASMQDDFTPGHSPVAASDRTESTLAESSSSASASASSAVASATAAASAATLAASAARAAADQVRVGIWGDNTQHRRPTSAMARSAAAAGAAASAASEARQGARQAQQAPRSAEAKSTLRLRDPSLLRIPSSQSTEAPSSKSISVVAPSPDGSGAYLFSRGESRAFGSRRQSSSLSSYPSFGLSSSGRGDSGHDQGTGGAGEAGTFFADDASRGGLFTDDQESAEIASPSGMVPEATQQRQSSGSLGMETGGSSSTDSPKPTLPQHETKTEALVSITQQQPVVLAPALAGPAPTTPSAAPGGGTLFSLVPAQVEHQRRARASRTATVGLRGRTSGSGRKQSSSSSRSFGGDSGRSEERVEKDVDPVVGEEQRRSRDIGAKSSSVSSSLGSSGSSTLRRAAAALASVAKAATGRGGSGSSSSGSSSIAGTAGKRPRFSGEVEVETTGQPEAKKMMAQAEGGGDAVTRAAAKAVELGSSFESVDSTSGVRAPPFLQRFVSTEDEGKGYASGGDSV